jgi:hypothetical protein
LASHVGPGAEHDVLAAQAEEFGGAQPSLHGEQQQRPVATPTPGIEVRRGEQSGHFDRREKVDRSPQIAFARHSEHALRQGAVLWCVQGHVAEKGMDRGFVA